MCDYKLKFIMCYLTADNFREKSARSLMCAFSQSRVNSFMSFDTFARIDFAEDDHKHEQPLVTRFDKFNRSRTNCLIYNLHETIYNRNEFDKCFIYRSNGYRDSSYGFVFLNTKTGKTKHIFGIEELPDAICVKLAQVFNSMLHTPIIDFYSRKWDAVKNRNGLKVCDTPPESEYCKMIAKYHADLIPKIINNDI